MAETNGLQNLIQQANSLPPARRLLLIATGLGSLAFFAWMGLGLDKADERLLYGGLAEDEASRVVEVLDAEKIPYRISANGSIHVPAPQVHEARMRVASRGLPSGGGVGFEIFDKPAFGVTDFVHKVNYRRALQGELARSIAQLESVEAARVQIAQPERRGFLDEGASKTSASVVVKLAPGRDLDASQVRGMVHVVASSVEGLDSERVTVVDERGRLLAPSGGDGLGAPAGALDHQSGVEQLLSHRIQSILERVVGIGGVIAHVRAELDFTQRETTEERYDPDAQVARSEQLTKETSSDSSSNPGGVPGAASNTPGGAGGGDASGRSAQSSERTVETINYEISKTVSHSVASVGDVQRLHVAVLLDGEPQEDGSLAPWSAERLEEFTELAKHAVGFSEERGDRIEVTSVPFRNVEFQSEEGGGGGLDPSLLGLIATGAQAVVLLIAIFLVARLVVKPMVDAFRPGAAAAGYPATAGDLEAQLQGGGGSGGAGILAPPTAPATLSEQVGQMAQVRGDDSVRTIKNWLSQG